MGNITSLQQLFHSKPATRPEVDVDEANDASNIEQNFRPITPPQLQRPAMSYTLDTGSRKRPADYLSSSPPMAGSPAKRATPSPADSAPHTPGVEALPEAALFGLTQGPSNRRQAPSASSSRAVSDSVMDRQRRAALEAEERHKQFVRDTQIANSYNLGLPIQRPLPTQSSTQSVLNRDGTFRRVSSVNGNGHIKAEPNLPFAATPSASFIKTEGGSSSRPTQPPFVPQDNRRRAVTPADGDSSSDLEEIGADEFISRVRRKNPAYTERRSQILSPAVQPVQQVQYPNVNNGFASGYVSPAMNNVNQMGSMSTLQNYGQQYAAMTGMPAGFVPALPSAVNAMQAASSYTMPGAFPGAANPYGPGSSMLASQYGVGISRPNSNRYQPPPRPSQYNPHASRSGVPSQVVNLLDDSDDDVQAYGAEYNYMRSDPTKTKEELDSLLADIAKGADMPAEMRRGTPDAMRFPLMEHQKVGFTWMKNKESGTAKGGILADDMGLGKTIQALALIAANRSDDRTRKTTLVVAPVALLYQWELEIKDKIKQDPEHKLSVHIHHGQKKKAFSALKQFDVVLTTFGSLTSELKKLAHWERVVSNTPNAQPSKKEQMSLLGPDCMWYRVILDEAQNIKNKDTGAAKAAFKLRSVYRWCMTGTPMMNNVGELWSLIAFCRLRPYNDIKLFREEIKNPLDKRDEEDRQEAMRKLQALIRGIMLRRTKASKIDGKPIITLPPRTNEVVAKDFEKDQEDFYRAVESQSQTIFNKYLKEGSVMRNYSHVLTLLLRLRQITDHPVLATEVVSDSGVETSEVDMLALAKKLSPDVVRRLKEQKENFMCPICIDAIPPPGPLIFFPCGHFLDNDCLSSLVMNAQTNMETDLKCPECRDKFDPKKIIDYMSFKKVHQPELLPAEEGGAADDGGETGDDDSDEESDDDSDDEGSLKDFIVDDDETEDEADEVNDEIDDGEGGEPIPQASTSVPRGWRGRKKGKGKEKKTKKSLAELRKEGRRNKKAWAKYLRRLEKTWETSAKIDHTLELLDKLKAEKPREKILIFSQFTSFLDFLEVPLRRRREGYQRYDGSMSMNDRQEAVKDFTTNPRTKLMLISLKAGNAGLNLNCASQVIILDPFWNPFIEEQAIDRAHRIGQQKEVNVHRIVIPNTVEDRILQLQEKKRDLINTALDENAGKSLSRLGVRELGFLFGVNRAPNS